MARIDEIARLVVALEAKTAKFDQALDRSSKEIKRLRGTIYKNMNQSRTSVLKFQQTVVNSMKAVGAAFAVREIVGFSKTIVESADKVKLLSQRLETFSGDSRAFLKAYDAAQLLGTGLEDAASGMTRLLVVGRELGVTSKQAKELYTTFAQLARLGGSSGQEASAAFIQLTQGLGAGVLRGQELNSILEQAPLVAQEIAKELGVSIGQLKKMGEEGRITSDVVLKALRNAAEGASEAFAKLPQTLEQQQQRLSNAWTRVLAGIDVTLRQSDLWQFFTSGLTESLERLAVSLNGSPAERIAQDVKGQAETLAALADQIYAAGGPGTFQGRFFQEQFDKAAAKMVELKGLAEEYSRAIAATDKYSESAAAAVSNIGEEAKKSKKELEEMEKFLDQPRKMREDAARAAAPIGASDQQMQDEINAALANLPKLDLKVEEIKESVSEIGEFGIQAARNMQSAFADFLFDPFENGLKGMLKGFVDTIRRMVAEIAAQQLLTSFFGSLAGSSNSILSGIGSFFGGGKARGGPVSSSKAYIVGEKGPELLVGASGRIIPGEKMVSGGGGMVISPVYNIDARGATQDLAKQLPSILAAHARQTVEMARRAINDDVSRGAFGRA